MKKKVQKALTALKNPSSLIVESRESVIVYKDDLETLLEWAEQKARGKSKKGFRKGDKVRFEHDVFHQNTLYQKGTQGVIVEVFHEGLWDFLVELVRPVTEWTTHIQMDAEELVHYGE